MAWNVAGKFVNPKNMTVGSNNPSGVVKATFHSLFYSYIVVTLPQIYFCKYLLGPNVLYDIQNKW